jgi:hypothetical protein
MIVFLPGLNKALGDILAVEYVGEMEKVGEVGEIGNNTANSSSACAVGSVADTMAMDGEAGPLSERTETDVAVVVVFDEVDATSGEGAPFGDVLVTYALEINSGSLSDRWGKRGWAVESGGKA